MNDTIYRQAAIDLLKKWSDGYSYIEVETNPAIKAFEEMPSAQPEGKWINADAIFHIQVYDDEHEEFTTKEMSLADILDAYTDEGCPDPGAAMK